MGKMMNGAAVTSLRSNGGAVDTCSKGISSSSSAPKAEKSLIFQITESSSRIFLLTAPTTAVTDVVAIVVGRSVGFVFAVFVPESLGQYQIIKLFRTQRVPGNGFCEAPSSSSCFHQLPFLNLPLQLYSFFSF